MADLRTKYLGLELAHPLMSGASPLSDTVEGAQRLEEGGAAAIVLRSLCEEQLRAESIATHASMAGPSEAFAEALSYLPDPDEFVLGPHEYVEHVGRLKRAVGIPVMASLNGIVPGPWLEYASMVEQAGADAIELNLHEVVTSVEATGRSIVDRSIEIIREVRSRTSLPVSVKLSPFYTSLPHAAASFREAGAAGLVLFNRFYQPDINVEELEITPHLDLSSRDELPLRLRWLAILSGSLDVELAVTGGVHCEIGVVKSIMCGAQAVQIVSQALRFGPTRFGQLRAGLNDWLDEHEYASVGQMHRSMDIKRCPDPNAHTRSQYLRTLQTWRAEGH